MESLGLEVTNPDFVAGRKEEGPLNNLTFVVTGTMHKPRKEIEELIEKLGGQAASAVSKSTDYLIVGEDPGSKLQKAKSLGVKTISYDEFLNMTAAQ